eukprot:EG_transcript_28470
MPVAARCGWNFGALPASCGVSCDTPSRAQRQQREAAFTPSFPPQRCKASAGPVRTPGHQRQDQTLYFLPVPPPCHFWSGFRAGRAWTALLGVGNDGHAINRRECPVPGRPRRWLCISTAVWFTAPSWAEAGR